MIEQNLELELISASHYSRPQGTKVLIQYNGSSHPIHVINTETFDSLMKELIAYRVENALACLSKKAKKELAESDYVEINTSPVFGKPLTFEQNEFIELDLFDGGMCGISRMNQAGHQVREYLRNKKGK